MTMLQGKCTICNMMIPADDTEDAMICPFCKKAIVVEKAIRYFKESIQPDLNLHKTELSLEPGAYNSTGEKIHSWEQFMNLELLFDLRRNIFKIVTPGNVPIGSNNYFFSCLNLEEVVISEGITELGDEAFKDCKKLRKVYLPKSLKVIRYSAFRNCRELEDINLPDNLVSIEAYAFDTCEKLANIKLPKSIAFLGRHAFASTAIEEFEFPERKIEIEERILSSTPIHEVNIPEWMDTIPNGTYSGCKNLKKVVIPDHVRDIGKAFDYCDNLEEVRLSQNLKIIKSEAFGVCRKLTSIVIPEGVTEIESLAFRYCTSLKKVVFPSTLKKLTAKTFDGCTALDQSTIDVINYVIEHGCVPNANQTKVNNAESNVLPESSKQQNPPTQLSYNRQEAKGQLLFLGLVWKRKVGEIRDNNVPFSACKYISKSFYTSSYACPHCNNALYKSVANMGIMVDGDMLAINNVFACTECKKLFATGAGHRLNDGTYCEMEDSSLFNRAFKLTDIIGLSETELGQILSPRFPF